MPNPDTTQGLTWKAWKQKIRALLDEKQAEGRFDIDTDTIFYFDVVADEALDFRKHKTLLGIGSEKPPVVVPDQPDEEPDDDVE